jgi:ABC-type sugar transport system ATPase subunit
VAALARGARPDVVVGIRPEHLELRGIDGPVTDGALAGHVFFREPRGDVDVMLVRLDRAPEPSDGPPGQGLVTVEIAAGTEWKEGDAVEIAFPARALHLFDAHTGETLLRGPLPPGPADS